MQSMADNENAIRTLIEDWARAISGGDRAAILAHHSPDFMMFDFPAPIIRGLEDYDQWDLFYKAPKGPLSFVPSELQVTAGALSASRRASSIVRERRPVRSIFASPLACAGSTANGS